MFALGRPRRCRGATRSPTFHPGRGSSTALSNVIRPLHPHRLSVVRREDRQRGESEDEGDGDGSGNALHDRGSSLGWCRYRIGDRFRAPPVISTGVCLTDCALRSDWLAAHGETTSLDRRGKEYSGCRLHLHGYGMKFPTPPSNGRESIRRVQHTDTPSMGFGAVDHPDRASRAHPTWDRLRPRFGRYRRAVKRVRLSKAQELTFAHSQESRWHTMARSSLRS